jgi:hypothetical protein
VGGICQIRRTLLAKSGGKEDISHNLYTPPCKGGAFFS